MKLEKNINKQIDEVSERDEMSIRKESQLEKMDNKKETNVFKFNDTFNEKIESYKNQISSLKNEN